MPLTTQDPLVHETPSLARLRSAARPRSRPYRGRHLPARETKAWQDSDRVREAEAHQSALAGKKGYEDTRSEACGLPCSVIGKHHQILSQFQFKFQRQGVHCLCLRQTEQHWLSSNKLAIDTLVSQDFSHSKSLSKTPYEKPARIVVGFAPALKIGHLHGTARRCCYLVLLINEFSGHRVIHPVCSVRVQVNRGVKQRGYHNGRCKKRRGSIAHGRTAGAAPPSVIVAPPALDS